MIFFLCCLFLFNLQSGCVRTSPPLIHLCLSLAPKPRTSRSHQVTLTCCMWHTASPVPLLTFSFSFISPHAFFFFFKCPIQWFLQFLIWLTCTWWMRLWADCSFPNAAISSSAVLLFRTWENIQTQQQHALSLFYCWPHWLIDASEKSRLKYLNNLDGLPWNNKTSTLYNPNMILSLTFSTMLKCVNLKWAAVKPLDGSGCKIEFPFRWITFIGKHFCLCNSCNTNGKTFRCIVCMKISR